jgi:hypothetical protein
LKTYKGELYAAGNAFYDSVSSGTIAHWNGSYWTEVIPGTGGTVTCFEVYKKDLYVGGAFGNNCSAPTTSNKVAIWNGDNWLPAGTGMNDIVYGLKTFDGNLYAGGNFTTADSDSVERIAKWEGNNWSAMPGPGFNDLIWCFGSYHAELYAGGMFTEAGGIPADHIAKWSASNDIVDFTVNKVTGIYPQPFHNRATIEIDNSQNENFTLVIYNIYGQLVREINNITTDKVTIERQDLKSGMYFFRLTAEGNLLGMGKMIIE